MGAIAFKRHDGSGGAVDFEPQTFNRNIVELGRVIRVGRLHDRDSIRADA